MGQGRRREHRLQRGAELVGDGSEPFGVLRSGRDRIHRALVFSSKLTITIRSVGDIRTEKPAWKKLTRPSIW